MTLASSPHPTSCTTYTPLKNTNEKERHWPVCKGLDKMASFLGQLWLQRTLVIILSLTQTCFERMRMLPDEGGRLYSSCITLSRVVRARVRGELQGNPFITYAEPNYTQLYCYYPTVIIPAPQPAWTLQKLQQHLSRNIWVSVKW